MPMPKPLHKQIETPDSDDDAEPHSGTAVRLIVQGDQITLRGNRRAVTTWRWPWHSVSETLEQIGFQPDERPSK